MGEIEAHADHLFEVCFEVCNKVGGIYTVVSSKALLMKKYYKNYTLIGPYYADKADTEFNESEVPSKFKEIFNELKEEGIIAHYGTWNIKGEPETILLEITHFKDSLDHLKTKYWEEFQVDSMFANWDFFEPMLWSTAAGKFIEKFQEQHKEQKIVGHFHEWISGFGLLLLRMAKSNAKTIFTTHATMLGRSISGSGEDLYGKLDSLNPEEEAKKHNVMDKFSAERACAKNADIFTTVSEITQIEAEKILGRKADVLTLNGLDLSIFPSYEEVANLHVDSKEKIMEFIKYYFFPYYTFDLSHTLIYFTSGRYEFTNKGIDHYIKALARLNEHLKRSNSKRTIVAFIFVPGAAKNIRQDVLENKTFFRHIKHFAEDNLETIKEKIITSIVRGKELDTKDIFDKEFLLEMKKNVKSFKKDGIPPTCTHTIENEENDPALNLLREVGLNNSVEQKVKVVLYPVYLDHADGLIDLSYYDTLAGAHLGVFPSYYEPWGYTPAESAIMGVPCITSDLAGFGRYMKKIVKEKEGIFVINRYQANSENAIEDLFDSMRHYASLEHQERVDNKIAAKEAIENCDWKDFVKFYIEAHNKALEK